MRKTIDFTKEEIERIKTYQERNGLKSFSAAVKNIIGNEKECKCKSGDIDNISDDKFALLADAILKLDGKVEAMLMNIAPKSAGEVK
jgi:hypothetical protein